jgi:hypothetical protein
MQWILIYITIGFGAEHTSVFKGNYSTMNDCFYARESLSIEVGGKDGHFPNGQQAVCIPVDNADT